jgi:hypothetical protein
MVSLTPLIGKLASNRENISGRGHGNGHQHNWPTVSRLSPEEMKMLSYGLSLVRFGKKRQKCREALSIRRFRAHYGIGPGAVQQLASDLKKNYDKPINLSNLFMALHWLKLYSTKEVMAGWWGHGEQYCRETTKMYVKQIRSMKLKKITFCGLHPKCRFAPVDCVHIICYEFRCDPDSKWWSHKSLAAFHCQSFVFLKCEKTNRAGTYALMEERFYGDPEKRIKGVCNQLIDGDNAFGFLYNKHKGVKNGIKRTLKPMCCGNLTSTNYVAGVHFTAKMIGTKSHKKLSGLSLWRAGLDVSRSIKKAMAILPKLDVKVVNLGKNLQVLGYASGKNFENFIQFIDNGMYSLSLKEGKGAANLLDSDDDNDVLGQVFGDDEMGKVVDDDVQEVIEHSLDSWNPFDSDKTPEGYLFFGKLSFLCLGPASDFFSETLSSKGRQVTSVEDKKLMGRAAMLKEVTARAPVNRDVGGSDRGMSLATKARFGFMAQNEDDAVQRHRNMRWATITKMIDTTQKMIDVKMRLADSMVGNGIGDELRMSVFRRWRRLRSGMRNWK